MALVQLAWCCPCGSPAIHARGRCLRCYDALRLSLRRFGGERYQTILRDGGRCTACGSERVVVHHRSKRLYVTLCPGCHARVERTLRPRWDMQPYLRMLWREVHPGLAEQIPLALALVAARPPEQLVLIAA